VVGSTNELNDRKCYYDHATQIFSPFIRSRLPKTTPLSKYQT